MSFAWSWEYTLTSGIPYDSIHLSEASLPSTSCFGMTLLGDTPYWTCAPILDAKDTMSNERADLPMRGGAAHMIGAMGGLVK